MQSLFSQQTSSDFQTEDELRAQSDMTRSQLFNRLLFWLVLAPLVLVLLWALVR